MSYAFNGWQNAGVKPVHDPSGKIRDAAHLYELLQDLWCADTCAPRMRQDWSTDNPTLGQCSITAFLVQDLFGGEVYGIPLPDGSFHCYNVIGDAWFDLTSEQFGLKAADFRYHDNPRQFREVHFAKAEKKARYEMLKELLRKKLAKSIF